METLLNLLHDLHLESRGRPLVRPAIIRHLVLIPLCGRTVTKYTLPRNGVQFLASAHAGPGGPKHKVCPENSISRLSLFDVQGLTVTSNIEQQAQLAIPLEGSCEWRASPELSRPSRR